MHTPSGRFFFFFFFLARVVHVERACEGMQSLVEIKTPPFFLLGTSFQFSPSLSFSFVDRFEFGKLVILDHRNYRSLTTPKICKITVL